ncbi:MAG: hypothetical protein HY600_01135 [Candidatus Omnitrophica bacterium]|nr:hypothetical protein [Candidatus Omnitrophota bacterium]
MTRQRLLLLVVILGALIGLGRWLSGRAPVTPAGEGPVRFAPATLSPDAVTRIEFSAGPATSEPQVRLARDLERGWQITSWRQVPADPERIGRVIGIVRGLTGEVRATGAQWFSPFRVGDGEGLRLVVWQGDQVVCDLVINRSPKASWMSVVRPRDREIVCVVEQNLLGELADVWGEVATDPPSQKPWADLRLFRTASGVRDLELAEQVKGAWVVRGERHAPFDAEAQGLVDGLRGARAREVMDPGAPPAGFTPRWRWHIASLEGASVELEEPAASPRAPSPPATMTVRRLPDGTYLTIEASTLASFRERLLPPPAPPKKPGSTKPPAKSSKPADGS